MNATADVYTDTPETRARRRLLTDDLVESFLPDAKRWIDEHIGEHRDGERTDAEVLALATSFAQHFLEGASVARPTPLAGDGKEGSRD